VTDWADLIECREDIGYAPMNEHLGEVVFRLANPNLNGPVTREVALEIRSQLRGSSHGIEWRRAGKDATFMGKPLAKWSSLVAASVTAYGCLLVSE
jgi:hypothetical protein